MKKATKKIKKKNRKTATAKPQKRQKRKKSLATLRRPRQRRGKFRASAVARKVLKKKSVRKRPGKKIKPKKKVKPKKKAKPKKKVIKRKRVIKKKRIVKRKKPVKKKKPRKPARGWSALGRKKVVRKRPKKKVVKKTRPKRKALRRARKPVKKAKLKKTAVKKRKIIKKRKPKRKMEPRKRVVKRRKPKKKIKRKKPVKRKIIRRRRKKSRPQRGRGPSIRRRRKSGPTKPRVYVGKGTLDQLFESQAKVKLLRFFFRNPGEMFQPKEIFKQLRSNIALLRQEIKKLEKLGLIKQRKAWLSFEKKRGGIRKEKKIVCCLNPNFDFLNELRNLVLKSTIASKSDLVEKAKKIGNIKLLVLTGVFTGDETARADLLIAGDKINQRKLNSFIKDLEAEVGKEINCAVMSTKEFDYRYDMYDRFIRDLLDGKREILIKRLELW